jgi:hypothetical protein
MLSTLDIVIAFAVIMTVLSLIITILVQMVSAALSLRGKNLANALSLTFQTIDPHIGEQAHSLAAQILRDPIFSDSIMRAKKRVMVPLANAATQAVIKAERVLKAAEQALARNSEQAKQAALDGAVSTAKTDLAKAKREPGVIQPPPVTRNREEPWSFWSWPFGSATHLGSAIRPGEIYRILHEFGDLTETEAKLRGIPSKLVETATRLIEELRKTDQPALESQRKLVVIGQVSQWFKNTEQQKAVVDSLANFGATVERATTQAYDRFQRWFGSGQDRAEQWFRTHTRMVTIVMAAVIAVVLQLDTIQIFRRLRDQPKLVEALVKSAPDVLKEGGTVLDPTNTAAYHAYLLWLQQHPLFPLKALPPHGEQTAYHDALADRLKQKGDPNYALQQFDSAFDLALKAEGFSGNTAAAVAKPTYDAWSKEFPNYKLDPEPDFAAATKESLHAAIQEKLGQDPAAANPPNAASVTQWLSEYDGLQVAGTMALEKARSDAYSNLKNELNDAGFDLAPSPVFGRWDSEQLPNWARSISDFFVRCLPKCASGFGPFVGHSLHHFLGIFMTAGLLALGAPFWFNLLKNLMSLRPAVASLIEKRPTSAPALPAEPATPPSPS